ncbi:MAG: MoaD/ThiS family protein [Verrucomicrobia bacterium]|nr:MoaD/ThiS family protein [Verrucomicrobiota bacterium]
MKILFFGPLKEITGCGEISLRCPGVDTDTSGVWQLLLQAYPGLASSRRVVRLARNAVYVGPQARFQDHDEVALIPPVSGG